MVMPYESRPRMKIPYSKKHKVIDIFSLAGIVLLIVFPYVTSRYLQERVPLHFDGAGNPNRFGSPEDFVKIWFVLIGAAIVTWVVLSLLRFIPHYFNLPVRITNENAEKQYSLGIDLIYTMKIGVVILFLSIQIMAVISAFRGKLTYEILLIFVPLAFLFYSLGSFIRNSLKFK